MMAVEHPAIRKAGTQLSTRNGIIGAVPATQVPRYAGKGTFARIADIHEVSDYDIAILGAPFDGGTS
jgi:agmatinase